MFRKKCDCEHCEKLNEAKGREKQALARQEKYFLQAYEQKQQLIAWLAAENQALYNMLQKKV